MSALRRRLGTVVVVLGCLLLTAGCGAGGLGGLFGGSEEPTPDPAPPIKTYVALGDGFAAAPYVGKMKPSNGCLRSSQNYPVQVAKRLGVKLTDLSCTGADTHDLLKTSKSPTGKGKLKAQIARLPRDTDLVTVSVGINDKDLLFRGFYVCMSTSCTPTTIPAQTLGQEAAAVGNSVLNVVRRIKEKAPDAYIVLVGYPRIAPEQDPCGSLPDMDQNQLDGVNALFDLLNEEIASVARQTGAEYVDLEKVSDEHDVCAEKPWIRKPSDDLPTKVSLHPLAPAQKAAADAVVRAVQNRR